MKNNLNVFKYNSFSRNPFKVISQFFRNIRYAYQRATKGYCERDVWNLDYFYLKLFYSTLRELADTTHGYPAEFEDPELWSAMLREIAEHFNNANEDTVDFPLAKETDELHEKMLEFDIFSDKTKEDPRYQELREAWFDKVKELANFRVLEKNIGFELLKKYFFDLWD